MKANRSDYLIAIGVIACSAVILMALTFALSGWKPRKHKRVIYVDFPDATGIRIHSAVRYAGAPAGKVSELRLLTDEERNNTNWSAVRVTLELNDAVPALPDDVRASLAADTLLSEKFVALSAGSPDRPKLENGTILLGATASGLDAAMEAVPTLVKSVDGLIAQLESTLGGVDRVVIKAGDTIDTLHDGIGDALPRISKLADALKLTAGSATAAIGNIDEMVDDVDPMLKINLGKLSGALDEMQKTLKSADALVKGTDKKLDSRMDELGVVLQNLKVVSTHAKVLSKALAEKPNRLIFSGKSPALPSEEQILRSTKPVQIRDAVPASRR
jgi:ABC-type transporter Mla subunit MlaD